MKTAYVPTSLQNTRGTPRDMVRAEPIFCHADETLLIRWQWKGSVYLRETEQREYATAADVLGLVDDDTLSISVVNEREGTCRDRSEEVAAAWLARNGDDCLLPPFVHNSAALVDYCDERSGPSVAAENSMTKTQIGVS